MTRFIALVVALGVVACGGGAEPSRETSPVRASVETSPTPESSGGATNPITEAHAARRAAHCAPPLVWSDALAARAQAWADHLAASGCRLEHSQSPYGENLAAGTTGTLSPSDVVDMWYAESSMYRFANGTFSMQTGHFTQLVWIGSEHLGCGMSQCDGLDVWVCNYDPPGNVEGEYATNVLPTSCR